jgi:hypothetical protein
MRRVGWRCCCLLILRHKESLKKLVLGPSTEWYCEPVYINVGVVQTNADEFSGLERLGWDMPC